MDDGLGQERKNIFLWSWNPRCFGIFADLAGTACGRDGFAVVGEWRRPFVDGLTAFAASTRNIVSSLAAGENRKQAKQFFRELQG